MGWVVGKGAHTVLGGGEDRGWKGARFFTRWRGLGRWAGRVEAEERVEGWWVGGGGAQGEGGEGVGWEVEGWQRKTRDRKSGWRVWEGSRGGGRWGPVEGGKEERGEGREVVSGVKWRGMWCCGRVGGERGGWWRSGYGEAAMGVVEEGVGADQRRGTGWWGEWRDGKERRGGWWGFRESGRGG